jgi:hypothetical protein
LIGTPCKSQDSLLHLCVNQIWRQRSPSPNWKKLCVPDAELDSMKVSFCQIRVTDQKAYCMIKLLILCMHACMYVYQVQVLSWPVWLRRWSKVEWKGDNW